VIGQRCRRGHHRVGVRQVEHKLVEPVRPVDRGMRPDNLELGADVWQPEDRPVFAVTADKRIDDRQADQVAVEGDGFVVVSA